MTEAAHWIATILYLVAGAAGWAALRGFGSGVSVPWLLGIGVVPHAAGFVALHLEDPPVETDVFRARLFWLGDEPLRVGGHYTLKLNTATAAVTVQSIERVIDLENLASREATEVERDGVGEVVLRAGAMLALDSFNDAPRTGRFVLVDRYRIVGGGIIGMEDYADQRSLITTRATNVARTEHQVTADARAARNRHRGAVIWLTGLSGAGKSTLAVEVERRLFDLGYQVYVLDGDNVRQGLNANLGFSPEDRAENIRRVGEMAALFARAGMIAVTAFISPYRSDRERARRAAGEDFHEVYVKADLAVCEARDPKGLYVKARAGEIADFTGISAPYEAPEDPDLVVDTTIADVDDCVGAILEMIKSRVAIDAG